MTETQSSLRASPPVHSGPTGNAVGPWLLALRPKTLTAALVPVVVASALCYSNWKTTCGIDSANSSILSLNHPCVPFAWWISIFALLSSVFIQIGTNLVNDALDFKKGADTESRIGPKRVTQTGLLTDKQVLFGAMICFLLATLFGVPLVLTGGWPIALVGLISIACAYGYTGGPFPLAYRGLGDLFVIIFFGWVAVLGMQFLFMKSINIDGFIVGTQIGFLATVLIAINNLRDRDQDVHVNKKTLAVRFGKNFARTEIAVLAFAPFILGAYWIMTHRVLMGTVPFIAIPLAIKVVNGIFSNEPSSLYNQFLGKAAGLHLLFGIGLAIAAVFS